MASRRAHPALGSRGPRSRGSLLLLHVSLGLLLLHGAQTEDRRMGTVVQRQPRTLRGSERSCVRSQPAEKACPPGQKPQRVDENLVLYQDWELDACVDAALLEANMSRVDEVPFTYQQLRIFKCKLDQSYPGGYPESLVHRMGYFFLEMTPEDIYKWNVTALETVKSLLKISKGREMHAQVTALIKRYVAGRGQLDLDTVGMLRAFIPTYVCSLSPELLGHVQESVIREIRAQHLEGCSPQQLDILYDKAHVAFRHLRGTDYLIKIQPFLGGASTEDLRDLIRQNITIDVATMKQLQPAAVKPLTVPEVQKLLGPNLRGLKAEMWSSPVREWIVSTPQSDLDQLGLGLQGGIPNGYLDLHLPGGQDVRGSV
ncbi:mesothelin [Sorex araneus]|uniref:mesothelin n=1 Tax=Sorex araneus TaxID=42254 RepID=UPI002433AFEA|nr:mesothelin [Sorex araneus]